MFSENNGIKLEINNITITRKTPHTQKLNNKILHNPQAKEEISRKIIKQFKVNKNKNKTYQNLWNAAKTVLRGKLIAINAYIGSPSFGQFQYI